MKLNYRKQYILQSTYYRAFYIFAVTLILLLVLTSCASQYPLNPKTGIITQAATPQTAKGQLHSQERNDSFLMLLAFSGGGTRAAAMSYGVLEALERIEVPYRSINKCTSGGSKAHTAR